LTVLHFETSGIDAAIVVGNAVLPGLISHRLHTEELMVIISPEAAERHDTWTPERIGGQALLNVASNANVWGEWFNHHGLPIE
jgi:LysR family glycine cleavage system transcriptional activator